mmetsp:Transcript_31988/g.94109  ORF Transcript_31988/g.94109 Transcript_31988/m.94109 type:complete len:483 (-) Transcript_31988:1628-3076(-)
MSFLQGFLEALEDAGLASAGRADEHDAMPNPRRLEELDGLTDPILVIHQSMTLHHPAKDGLLLGILPLAGWRHAREQVGQQRQKERNVLRHQLGQVHIADGPVHQHGLGRVQILALGRAHGPQHRQDVAQTPIVVPLIGQLLLARGIQREELGREQIKVGIAHRTHLDLLDYLKVRRHHGNASEQSLEVLRQLLTTSVAWIHGNEEGADLLQDDILRISGELEYLEALLLGVLNGQDLLCHHRQYRERDAIELVEASPQSALAETLEDLGAVGVLHLIRAVGNDDEYAQAVAQILYRLGLSGTGRSCRSSAKVHAQGLGQGDVALVREGCDDQALLGSQILVLVVKIDVGDGNDRGTVVADVVGRTGTPVETGLLEPVKVIGILHLTCSDQLHQFLRNVALMDVDGNKGFNLLPIHLGPQILEAPRGHLRQYLHLALAVFLHGILFGAALFQGGLRFVGPHNLNGQQSELGNAAIDQGTETA